MEEMTTMKMKKFPNPSSSFLFNTALIYLIRTTIQYSNTSKVRFLIPSANTTYYCKGFRMPDIGGKRHMIKVEPIITPGNEMHVHHILIYRCKGINPKFDGISYMCYDEIPKEMNPCYDVIIAWAIGGKSFYYPDHLGVSVGAPDDPDFYIMETHYDNPVQKSGDTVSFS
ncbi:hypothetical protein CHS0354_001850 [Potamilus streckersoni]|uniref:Copper type II ascorbate-dependent monooxygenase N-terminal domain-containing protein n=1 Tax=Potamilus streckersoni TaxID=2493646 RepID=A0AAE0S7Z0_9BIVA|nr:hypothetical protein CHS0354_001850 [Potamilus streckersoni]